MVLGMLKNNFVSRDPELWKRLYTTYVNPHLEYAIPERLAKSHLYPPSLETLNLAREIAEISTSRH